jgi:hypothetical protein
MAAKSGLAAYKKKEIPFLTRVPLFTVIRSNQTIDHHSVAKASSL